MDFSFLDQIPIWNQLSPTVQQVIIGIVVVVLLLLVFSFLSKVVSRIVVAPIRRAAKRSDNSVDDTLADAIDGGLAFLVLALTLLCSTVLLPFAESFATFLFRVALTLFVVGFARFFYDLACHAADSDALLMRLSPGEIRPSFRPLIGYGARFIVLALGILFVAEIWDVNAVGLVTGLGLGGLALSLAAKDLLSDFLGFLVITYDDLFAVEEYIVSQYGEGIIESIGLRSTAIRQLNQGLVYIPNGQLANAPLTNWSRLEKRWFNFNLPIAFDTTAEQVDELVSRIKDKLTAREKVVGDSVVVLFTEYADYALSILIRCYVEIEDWTEAHAERHAVNLDIMRTVSDMGLSVALPSRSLYLEEVPGDVLPGKRDKSEDPGRERKRHTVRAGSAATSYFRRGGQDTDIDGNEQQGSGDGDAD